MKTVSILGSTGSVGRNTVDLIESTPEDFKVVALTAQNNVDLLADQARRLGAQTAVIGNPDLYAELKEKLSGTSVRVQAGPQAIIETASQPADWTMAAIVGVAGLAPTLAAIGQGRVVALANKEALVCAGPLMMAAVKKSGATLLPVDSEHNAVFQVFDQSQRASIERIILTASGGPFLNLPLEKLSEVTVEQALRHPTWSMGPKISVDSATMMNKALEVIEAKYIFDLPVSKIDVLIHPQSIVHAMVEYSDGSVLNQMGASDMRTPIAHTLAWPSRIKTSGKTLNLNQKMSLTFEPIDLKRFQALDIVYNHMGEGASAPVVFNAANEEAVSRFLAGQIGFDRIVPMVAQALEEWLGRQRDLSVGSLEHILDIDRSVRGLAAAA